MKEIQKWDKTWLTLNQGMTQAVQAQVAESKQKEFESIYEKESSYIQQSQLQAYLMVSLE